MSDEDKEFEQMNNPPVEEVVLGVVFEPLPKLTGPYFGIYWQPVKNRFPNFSSRPAMPALIEKFESPFLDMTQAFQLQLVSIGSTVPLQRYIYHDERKAETIQIQNDVATFGWTRREPTDRYPEYAKSLRNDLANEWARLGRFCTENDLGILKVRQCEANYVDLIPRGTGWQTFADLPEILSLWSGKSAESFPNPDSVTLQAAFPMNDGTRGRVFISVGPARRLWDSAECLMLNIVSKVVADSGEPEKMLESMDKAHDWARRAFVAATTSSIRDIWKGAR